MAKIYQLKRMAIILNRLRDGRSARPDELVEYVSREMENIAKRLPATHPVCKQ